MTEPAFPDQRARARSTTFALNRLPLNTADVQLDAWVPSPIYLSMGVLL
jgi:hypothetical protein